MPVPRAQETSDKAAKERTRFVDDWVRAIAGEAEQPFGDEAFARAAREQRQDT